MFFHASWKTGVSRTTSAGRPRIETFSSRCAQELVLRSLCPGQVWPDYLSAYKMKIAKAGPVELCVCQFCVFQRRAAKVRAGKISIAQISAVKFGSLEPASGKTDANCDGMAGGIPIKLSPASSLRKGRKSSPSRTAALPCLPPDATRMLVARRA